MNTVELKLTNQEQKIINYLAGKERVNWEELAQFAKDPQSVKLKTLQKVISDLRRKYTLAGIPAPFTCTFSTLAKQAEAATDYSTAVSPTIGSLVKEKLAQNQTLIQMRRTLAGKQVPATNTEPDAHLDYRLDKYNKVVISYERGRIALSDGEYEIFSLLHVNAGKPVSIEQMKNVRFPAGSKCPPTWSEQISSSLTKLRKNIPELKTKNRLSTVTTATKMTAYMLI